MIGRVDPKALRQTFKGDAVAQNCRFRDRRCADCVYCYQVYARRVARRFHDPDPCADVSGDSPPLYVGRATTFDGDDPRYAAADPPHGDRSYLRHSSWCDKGTSVCKIDLIG